MKLEPPADIDTLCIDLGIGLKRRARLAEDHGEDFLAWLQKMWRWAMRQDEDNFLHENPGMGRSDYTNNSAKAMKGEYGPEWAPPRDEIATYRASRDARDDYQAQRLAEVGDLVAAMHELRSAIDALPAERKQRISKTLWTLRARLDSAERELRRRLAA